MYQGLFLFILLYENHIKPVLKTFYHVSYCSFSPGGFLVDFVKILLQYKTMMIQKNIKIISFTV